MIALLKKTTLFLLLFLAGWYSAAFAATGSSLQVFVSIPPQAFLAERLAGSATGVAVLVDKGQDPHTFVPSPRQILSLSKANIYFTIGIPFEKPIVEKIKASNTGTRIIDSAAGITKRRIEDHIPDHKEHTDHPADRPGDPDPHVWLSPPLLKIIAGNMVEAFIAADPEQEDQYRKNYLQLSEEIERTHRTIAAQLAPFRGETIYVYHPAFGYLADTYGLTQRSVEISGKSPSVRELTALIRQAQAENVRIIFVQPQFDTKSALAIAAAIHGTVVPLDSLARDLLQSITHMATEIEKSHRR